MVGEEAGAGTFSAAGELAGRHIQPNADLHASEQYRRDIASTLTRRALEQAAARCRQEG